MDEPSRNESNTIILRIKFKSTSLEEFSLRYGSDVSPGGIFIKTKQPLDVGASLQFEFSLADGSPLLFGNGTVAWIRENDPLRSNNSPGMGLRFDKLNPDSHQNHQRILARKAKAPDRTVSGVIGSPPPGTIPSPVKPATTAELTASPNLSAPIVDLEKLLDEPTVPGTTDSFFEGAKTEITDRSFTDSILAAEKAKRKSTSEIQSVAAPYDDGKPISSPISLAPPDPDAVVAVDVGTGSMELPLKTTQPGPVPEVVPFDLSPMTAEPDAPEEELEEFSAPTPMEDTPEEIAPEQTVENPVKVSFPIKESIGMQGFSMPPTPAPATSVAPATAIANAPLVKPSTLSGKLLWIVAVVAAVLAFGLVYLFKTKPWQTPQPITQATKAISPVAPPTVAEPKVELPAPPLEKATEATKAALPEKVDESAKTALPVKPTIVALEPEKAAPPETANPATPKSSKSGKPAAQATKTEEAGAAAKQTETHRWLIRSVPANAEVLIDGEYFCRTPCDRRVLDPLRPAVITLRRVGYEPFERSLGPSETWVKRGKDNSLTVLGKLVKIKPAAAPAVAPPPSEPKPLLAPPPLAPKAEVAPSAEEVPKSEPPAKSKAKPAPDF